MELETGLLLLIALAVPAVVVWLVVTTKAELRALRGRLNATPPTDGGSSPEKAAANPRLAAARAAAAARTAKRPGRATVKRI